MRFYCLFWLLTLTILGMMTVGMNLLACPPTASFKSGNTLGATPDMSASAASTGALCPAGWRRQQLHLGGGQLTLCLPSVALDPFTLYVIGDRCISNQSLAVDLAVAVPGSKVHGFQHDCLASTPHSYGCAVGNMSSASNAARIQAYHHEACISAQRAGMAMPLRVARLWLHHDHVDAVIMAGATADRVQQLLESWHPDDHGLPAQVGAAEDVRVPVNRHPTLAPLPLTHVPQLR